MADRPGRLADPACRCRVLTAQYRQFVEGVVAGQDDVAPVLAEHRAHNPVGDGHRRDVPVVHDGQVHRALRDHVRGGVRVLLDHPQVQVRVLAGELGQQVGQVGGRGDDLQGLLRLVEGDEDPAPSWGMPLQAAVTEPVRPFLHPVVVSGTLHVYVSQTDRGELVIGSEIEPYSSYSFRSTLSFMESSAKHMLELMPVLAEVKVVRQWAGICDMTPDYSPIMGFTPVTGFVQDVGWGTYGFKASPIAGKSMAELIATNRTPQLIAPFSLERFSTGKLVGEKAAASVSH